MPVQVPRRSSSALGKTGIVLLVLLGFGLLAVCGVAALGLGWFTLGSGVLPVINIPQPSATNQMPEDTTAANTRVTPKKTSTTGPTKTSLPPVSSQTPLPPPTQSSPSTFKDSFDSLSTGWLQIDDDTRMMGYSEGAMYVMALKKAGSDAEVLIPHGFQLPIHEADIHFTARPVTGKGYFGVLCDYVDSSNEIYIGITEGNYYFGRIQNGVNTSMLGSSWTKDPMIRSENGDFQVFAHCGETLQLMVNGYSVPPVANPDRTRGDVGIFATSNKNSTLDLDFFYKLLIDDLDLSAN
jgi:hypothetical protein